MRDQLHLMELVDNYLDGTMNNTDRTAFEERLRNSEELRSLVDDQLRLRQAARRSPARAAAKKAYRNYMGGKTLPGIGAGAVVLIGVAAALFLWTTVPGDTQITGAERDDVRSISPPIKDRTADHAMDSSAVPSGAESKLNIQVLAGIDVVVDPLRDTTVITPGGVVLDVPRGAFVYNDGRAVESLVHLSVKEALDPISIIRCGLSTMSGQEPLETGGMLRITASAQGRSVGIRRTQPLMAMIPAQDQMDDMQLYEGVQQADGRLDWRNPVPMRRSLVPVDITTLCFYPAGYEKKLAEMQQDVLNRSFKDSLFYSFSFGLNRNEAQDREAHGVEYRLTSAQLISPMELFGSGSMDSILTYLSYTRPDSLRLTRPAAIDSPTTRPVEEKMKVAENKGIDPAKIKAIWNQRFNGTNLATKEFETRLAEIYRTCDPSVLDAYVQRLDADLSEIDADLGRKGFPAFSAFAERKDGRVELPEGAADRLRKVYERWSREEAAAIHAVQERFWREQRVLDRKSNSKQAQQGSTGLASGNGAIPYSIGFANSSSSQSRLVSAMASVRSKRELPARPLPRRAWVAPIFRTGWVNCDRPMYPLRKKEMAVRASAAGKKQPTATDATTAAILSSSRFTVRIQERAAYDELVVYLIPQGRNSFQRVPEASGAFTGTCFAIYTYDFFCLATKGSGQFAFSTTVDPRKELIVSLQAVDETALKQMLRGNDYAQEQALEVSRYFDWLVVDKQRRAANARRLELRNAVRPVVFPCTPTLTVAKEARSESTGIEIPSAFSPNADGSSDALIIGGGSFVSGRMTISVISSGLVVATVTGWPLVWNGRSTDGQPADDGFYRCDVEVVDTNSDVHRATETVRLFR